MASAQENLQRSHELALGHTQRLGFEGYGLHTAVALIGQGAPHWAPQSEPSGEKASYTIGALSSQNFELRAGGAMRQV
jgi:hypothetical protein